MPLISYFSFSKLMNDCWCSIFPGPFLFFFFCCCFFCSLSSFPALCLEQKGIEFIRSSSSAVRVTVKHCDRRWRRRRRGLRRKIRRDSKSHLSFSVRFSSRDNSSSEQQEEKEENETHSGNNLDRPFPLSACVCENRRIASTWDLFDGDERERPRFDLPLLPKRHLIFYEAEEEDHHHGSFCDSKF